jgi:hypothetical protein
MVLTGGSHEEIRENTYKILVRKHNRTDQLRNLKERVCEGMDWIQLVQNRFQWRPVVNTVMSINGFHKGYEFLYQMSNYQLPKEDPAPSNKQAESTFCWRISMKEAKKPDEDILFPFLNLLKNV